MPLISIIIPIFKVEKYLNKCINSVLNQNFKDIEIILVNDGSPDNCPQICDNYASTDQRIKVIHKENGGLSEARNFGIKAGTGQYLVFLDSDDYWEGLDCLQNIVTRLQSDRSPDVLVYGCTDYLVNTNKKIISRTGYNTELIRNSTKEAVLNYFFKSGLFPGSAWITVTKRTFILDNQLFFIKGIKAEDIDWLLSVFLKATVFDAVNDPFYIYLKYRNDSITGTSDVKSMKDVLFTIDKWYRKIQEQEYNAIRKCVLGYLAFQYGTVLVIASKFDEHQLRDALPAINKYAFLLKYALNIKAKMVNLMHNIFGINTAIRTVGYFHRIKRNFR